MLTPKHPRTGYSCTVSDEEGTTSAPYLTQQQPLRTIFNTLRCVIRAGIL